MPSVLPLPQEQSEWLMGPEGSVGTGTVLDSHGEPPLLWGGGGHCTASGGIATGSLSHPRKEEENHGCSEAFPQHLLEGSPRPLNPFPLCHPLPSALCLLLFLCWNGGRGLEHPRHLLHTHICEIFAE